MRVLVVAMVFAVVGAGAAAGQQDPQAGARVAAQKAAMAKLAFLDGEWRGPSRTLIGPNQWRDFTQAERVGPMLDGTVRVLEGRGYDAAGKLNFNAFAVISYEPDAKAYVMHSYQGGRVGDFALTVTDSGFAWDLDAGPGMKIHYEATVKDGVWTEAGYRATGGAAPVKIYEFSVTRLRDTSWPAAGAIPPK